MMFVRFLSRLATVATSEPRKNWSGREWGRPEKELDELDS